MTVETKTSSTNSGTKSNRKVRLLKLEDKLATLRDDSKELGNSIVSVLQSALDAVTHEFDEERRNGRKALVTGSEVTAKK